MRSVASVVLLLALLADESTAAGFYYGRQKDHSYILGYALSEPNGPEPWSCRVRLYQGANKLPLGPMVFEKFVSCSVTEMTFPNLELGQRYAVNVSGVKMDVFRGEDTPLTASQSTAFDMRQVPVPLVTATPISDSQILVQWSYDFVNGSSFPLQAELILGGKVQTVDAANNWAVGKDLDPGKAYGVGVKLTYVERGSFVQNSSAIVPATTFAKDLLKPDLTVENSEIGSGESTITLKWKFPEGHPQCQFDARVCLKEAAGTCYSGHRGAAARQATLTQEFALGAYEAVMNATCKYEELATVVWPSDPKEFTLSKKS